VPNRPGSAADGAASDEVLNKIAAASWPGEWYTAGGGGHVWNSLVYDSEFNQLYLPTGNGFPWNPNLRTQLPGDNLFIASVVAIDANTGKYKWHYQESPGEGWDHDAISDIVLTDLTINNQVRKVLIHPPKNGFMYVINRQTGKVLSADAYVSGINWATHVDLATGKPNIVAAARYKDQPAIVSPGGGGGGGHNWNPISFSPQTNLLYLQISDNSSSYLEPISAENYQFADEKPSLGISFMGLLTGGMHGAAPINAKDKDPSGKKTSPAPSRAPAQSYLMAWDPVARKPAWKVESRGGGVLATAGNLVFQGKSREGVLGELVAYRADNGERLWGMQTPNAMVAGPMSYSVDGEQYIAIASGANSMAVANPVRMPQRGRLLVFKLNGNATLPDDPPLALPANPPVEIASTQSIQSGQVLYNDYCIRCHGPNAMGNNVIPDLRRSAALTQKEVWQSIVSDGAFESRGMMGWSKFITREQVDDIRLYVGERARALLVGEPAK
jgi:quinohemoprotein ethanol dehydrogenase